MRLVEMLLMRSCMNSLRGDLMLEGDRKTNRGQIPLFLLASNIDLKARKAKPSLEL